MTYANVPKNPNWMWPISYLKTFSMQVLGFHIRCPVLAVLNNDHLFYQHTSCNYLQYKCITPYWTIHNMFYYQQFKLSLSVIWIPNLDWCIKAVLIMRGQYVTSKNAQIPTKTKLIMRTSKSYSASGWVIGRHLYTDSCGLQDFSNGASTGTNHIFMLCLWNFYWHNCTFFFLQWRKYS